MNIVRKEVKTRAAAGFSLVESLVAISIVSVLFIVNMGAISMHRIQGAKEMELSIVSDFCGHYLEQVRGMDFDALTPNTPINHLFNGEQGAPNIRIPVDEEWIRIDTEDYQIFHPELVALDNRELEMRVDTTTTSEAGVARSKHVLLEIRWNPPLGKGSKLLLRNDLVRYRDI